MDVLLIASDQEAIDWLALAISIRGHAPTRSSDAVSALARLSEKSYSLVIIDDIPDGDVGRVRLCQQIRAHPTAHNVAIWVVADADRPAGVVMAIDAGATSFLVRPLDAQQLRTRLESIERVTPRSASDDAGDEIARVLESLPDIVAIVDAIGQIQRVNSRVERSLGFRRGDLEGANIESLCHPDDVPTLLQRIRSAMERPDTTPGFDIRLQRSDREWLAVDVRCSDMRRIPSVGGLLLLIRDATERRIRERDQERHALFDPLTGLANRELFNVHLSRSLARGERVNRTLAVMFLDLMQPGATDERTSQPVEVTALTHAADRIQRTIRANDVAARLGGDAFVVLIEDLTGEDDARTVARRIQSAIETPVSVGGEMVAVAAAVGIALSRPGITSATDILRDADRALRQSKISRGERPAARRVQTPPEPPEPPANDPPSQTAADTEDEAPSAEPEQSEPPIASEPDSTPDPPEDDPEPPPAGSDVIERFLALEAHLAQLLDKEKDSE